MAGTKTLLALAAFFVALLSLHACAARAPVGAGPAEIDAWITAEVLRALEKEPDVVVADLRIETRDGVVTLAGVQHSMESVAKALERAARVDGVVQVINQIRVVGAGERPALAGS